MLIFVAVVARTVAGVFSLAKLSSIWMIDKHFAHYTYIDCCRNDRFLIALGPVDLPHVHHHFLPGNSPLLLLTQPSDWKTVLGDSVVGRPVSDF